MRTYVSLATLAVLVFESAAVTQMDDDQMMEDDRTMSSPSASASAMSPDSPPASATSGGMMSASPTTTTSPSPADAKIPAARLPHTGSTPLMPLLSAGALALLAAPVGCGLVASRRMRGRSIR